MSISCALIRHLTLTSLFLLFASSAFAQGGEIFSDDFELGTAGRWPSAVGVQPPLCAEGPAAAGLLGGDLGTAPTEASTQLACLELTNDQGFERIGEIAFSGIPIPRDTGLLDLSRLALIGRGERRLAAQFDVLARWGGPVDDASRPVRWLAVSLPARVAAGNTTKVSLRRYAATPSHAADPFAARVTPAGAQIEVDTGIATFRLDPKNPALFEEIAVDLDDDGVGRATIYRHTPGAGPRLAFDPGGGEVILDTATAGRVTVDPNGFEIVRDGPVRVVVVLRGHFSAPGGASLCAPYGVTPYERFGYTAVATFTRGRRDVDLELYLRNECGDASGGPWTDEAITVRRASWVFPFDELGTVTPYHAGLGAAASASASGVRVEQRKGAGNTWRRRARILEGGQAVTTGEALDRPLLALADSNVVVAASMPWMRYREPQALEASGKTLRFDVIGEPLVVGEAKAIWNVAKVRFVPRAALSGDLPGHLDTLRHNFAAELERGLLVRMPRASVNASGLYPSLGTEAASPIKTAYRQTLDLLHHLTVDPGAQWDRSKTFGSQLWPDVQFDPWSVDAPSSPAENGGAMNYWNPSGAELLEFLRMGDPKWVWDFALPQSRLQMHTAYINLGEHDHGNRNGTAVTSGGTGEGQWHRSAFGSDDYSYNAGLALAYTLRPSPAMRARFAQAGRMLTARYSVPRSQEASREAFVNQVDITRQVIQHFEMLANCAEFVPGVDGQACHDRLVVLTTELAEDNLRPGILCQGDAAPTSLCFNPQRFMVNSLMYWFLDRYLRQVGDTDGRIRRALVEDPWVYYVNGLPRLSDGVSIDVGGEWASILECSLAAGGTAVASCSLVQNGDGNLLWHNKPHGLALLVAADALDPSLGLCAVARRALDHTDITLGWQDNLSNNPGWWKGAAQMMQGMVFGVGLYDVCSEN